MNSTTTTAEVHLPPTPFNQDSWDRWITRERAHDMAGRQKKRRLVLLAIAAVGLGAAFWLL